MSRLSWLVLCLSLCIVGCEKNSYENYADMNKIPMQTVCVGRMLVDLPQGKLDWQQHFDYAKVQRLPTTIDTIDSFWNLVEQNKNKLSNQKHRTDTNMLSGYKKVDKNSAMLLHRNSKYDISGYDLDRYLWLGNWGYKFESKALLANNERTQFTQFDKFSSQLKSHSDATASRTAGFCIDSAVVTGKIGPIWSGPSIQVKQWKGVSVSAGAREDDGSREPLPWQKNRSQPTIPTAFDDWEMINEWASESKRSDADDRVVSFDTKRKRKKEIAGMEGQEIVIHAKLANGQNYYRFEWDSINDDSRKNNSGFSLSLNAGAKQYTSNYQAPPHEENLLALWDAMLSSLRPRSGAH